MPEEPQANRGNVILQWAFPEFTRYERTRGWYISFFVFILAVLTYAVLTKNYTFSILIVLIALVMVTQLRRTPPLVNFAIRDQGIEVGYRFYPWREFKEYWIIYRPPEVKKLYVEFKLPMRPSLDIPLENQNPLKLREVLSAHLLENVEKEEEPATDQLSRMLKI